MIRLIDKTKAHIFCISKIFTILSFLCLGLVLYIAATTLPAKGYELCIYQPYHFIFWFFLVLAYVFVFVVLINEALFDQRSIWWLIVLASAIFSHFVLLSLRTFRGYPLADFQDLNIHLAHIENILARGYILDWNFYPIIHLIAVSMVKITGISLEIAVTLISMFSVTLYIIGLILLAKVLSQNRAQIIAVTAFSCIPIFTWFRSFFNPAGFSMFFIPLLLYLYHRRNKYPSSFAETSIAIIILALFIVFAHPMTALLLIIVFLTFGLASFVHHFLGKSKHFEYPIHFKYLWVWKNHASITYILIIVFFAWFLSFAVIKEIIFNIWNFLLYDEGLSLIQLYADQFNRANLNFNQVIDLFIKRYGAITLYFLTSVIFSGLIFKRTLINKTNVEPVIFTYAIQFIVITIFSSGLLFLAITEGEVIRQLRFSIMFSTILNGLSFGLFLNKRDQHDNLLNNILNLKRPTSLTVMIILILSTIISIFNYHHSPITMSANHHITHMELSGTKWLAFHHQPGITVERTGSKFDHLQMPLLHSGKIKTRIPVNQNEVIPPHFGYTYYDTIAEAFDFNMRFMVITKLDKIFPQAFPENIRPQVRYTYDQNDFIKLNSDSTAVKIYTNSEYEVWLISPPS